MYSMYYYYVCTEPYLFIQSIYVHSIKNRNKAVEEPWIMCSLSCIATAHVLGTATGGNIAMYGIYMMAPSTATLAAHHAFHIWMLEWEVRVWFELQVHTSTSKQPTNKCDNRHQVAVRIFTEN